MINIEQLIKDTIPFEESEWDNTPEKEQAELIASLKSFGDNYNLLTEQNNLKLLLIRLKHNRMLFNGNHYIKYDTLLEIIESTFYGNDTRQ